MGGLVHVHAPQPDTFGLQRIACSTCGKRRWMLWRATPWYGTDVTCLRCGEGWRDGERCGRPFAPHWRRHSVKAARALYRRLRASRLAGDPAEAPESVSA